MYEKDGHGQKDPSKRLKEENEHKVGIDKFDERDPSQNQMKLLFGCGIKFGLRGSSEHTYLEVRNITHGFFAKNIHSLDTSTMY